MSATSGRNGDRFPDPPHRGRPQPLHDILWDGARFTRFPGERLASTSTHGTGCTLSSAIAACLARGRALEREAKAYVTAAIREGFQTGRGVGALRHFVERW
jgi:hydroxymethylpyrimidine/phosphomethylpyrimidine kinase